MMEYISEQTLTVAHAGRVDSQNKFSRKIKSKMLKKIG